MVTLNKYEAKVVIIGGGIGGCITALRLAELSIPVIIIEQNTELMLGTSNNTPGRMGLGFHYCAHLGTAIHYLKATVEFNRLNPGFTLANSNDKDYLSGGQYFVTKDSLISAKAILNIAKSLQAEYRKLTEDDINNQLFASPEEFYKIIKPSIYQNYTNKKLIAIGLETQESLLDWSKFRQNCLRKIYQNPYIKVMNNTSFKSASYNKKVINYNLQLIRENQLVIINTPYVVNCSWHNIESINKTIGIEDNQPYTNRLKLLAEVRLPKSLSEKKSMFFCLGPHAMFSNLGNGIGRITYAKVTNVFSSQIQLPQIYQNWLKFGLTNLEKNYFGEKIIAGVSNYIPMMSQAKLLNVYPGIVKSKGEVDINNIKSQVHRRDYNGVTARLNGWIDNACMKLFYCEQNAKEVVKLITDYELAKKLNIISNSVSTRDDLRILTS